MCYVPHSSKIEKFVQKADCRIIIDMYVLNQIVSSKKYCVDQWKINFVWKIELIDVAFKIAVQINFQYESELKEVHKTNLNW